MPRVAGAKETYVSAPTTILISPDSVTQTAEATLAAVDAGVSAYVVDGLAKQRIKPVLDVAIRRFQAFSRLQVELAEARTALADRHTIDRAKAILMRRRGIDEPAAYALLRFGLEFLRGHRHRPKLGLLSEAQWLSVVLVPACVWLATWLAAHA